MLAMSIVSPWLAPTWKLWFWNEPSSSLTSLKLVVPATRSISANSCCASAFSAPRSEAELVALRDCTASSRMRCRLLPISAIAPSAVCDSEMPSLALRAAWSMPRIWVVKRCEMARPAASSLALLMRMPEDRRCRLVARSAPDAVRLRCALSDITLVLMTDDIWNSPGRLDPAATRRLGRCSQGADRDWSSLLLKWVTAGGCQALGKVRQFRSDRHSRARGSGFQQRVTLVNPWTFDFPRVMPMDPRFRGDDGSRSEDP